MVLEGGRADIDDVQTVVEVFAERPLCEHLQEILVGGGDEPEVDGNRLCAAEADDGARFDRPEKLHLRVEVDFADFVQKERAAVGGFEAAGLAVLKSARECAGHIAEELRLQQVLRQGRAFDGDEGALGAGREVVERAGDEFLAGAARAFDEDGGVCRRDLADEAVDLFHCRRLAGEGFDFSTQLVLEVGDFLFERGGLEGLLHPELELA